jgi:hypothetical protein
MLKQGFSFGSSMNNDYFLKRNPSSGTMDTRFGTFSYGNDHANFCAAGKVEGFSGPE